MIAVITYTCLGNQEKIHCEDRSAYSAAMSFLKHPDSTAQDIRVYECVEMENPLGA